MTSQQSPDIKTDQFLNALAGDAVDIRCIVCQSQEWVIPLDEPIDEAFIANYLCGECEPAAPTVPT